DPHKRAHYDQHGRELGTNAPGPRRGSGGPFQGADDIDPAEIFNMFFGGSPFAPQGYVFRSQFGGFPPRARGGAQQGGGGAGVSLPPGMAQILQLLPIFLLVLLAYLGQPSAPEYSLQRGGRYGAPLATVRRNVPFFVNDVAAIDKVYPPTSRKRMRLENEVENDYKEMLQQKCYNERMIQQRYTYFGRADKARAMELEHCKQLNEVFGTASGRVAAAAG
ncbi:hypothetical protein H632_c1745p0, partial [Helicosporidium sp. ATCC 50920]